MMTEQKKRAPRKNTGVSNVKQSAQVATIDLGGKTRKLVYDMNAFGVLEQRFGTVEAAMSSLEEGKIGNVKVLLWAGLIHDEVVEFDEVSGEPTKYNITPFDVGSWISSPAMLQGLMQSMAKALTMSLPENEAPDKATEGK